MYLRVLKLLCAAVPKEMKKKKHCQIHAHTLLKSDSMCSLLPLCIKNQTRVLLAYFFISFSSIWQIHFSHDILFSTRQHYFAEKNFDFVKSIYVVIHLNKIFTLTIKWKIVQIVNYLHFVTFKEIYSVNISNFFWLMILIWNLYFKHS